MNEQAQVVVDSYMKDLKRELRALPRDRRKEILEDIGGHIDESLGRNRTATEADARTLLEQLGEPSEIASEARERFGIPPSKFGAKEIFAVILLPFGAILGGIGYLVGLFLLWTSNAWNGKEKLIGTLVPLPLSIFFLLVVMLPAESCDANGCTGGTSALGEILLWSGLVLGAVFTIGVPIWLAVKAHRRAAPAGS